MTAPISHFDAETLLFAEKDLLAKSSKIYRRKNPPLKLANGQILPLVIIPDGEWADVYEVREFDSIGINCIISDYAKGGNRVGTVTRTAQYKIKTHGSFCGWSWEEVNKARASNRALESEGLEATRNAYDKYINFTGYHGDEAAGLPGIFNTPVQRRSSSVQINGNFTPDQIIGMLNDHVSFLSSNEVALPKKLVLPTDKYNYLFNPRPYGDKTIGQMFLENQRELGYIESIIGDNNLKGKGTNGTDVMLILPDNPEEFYVAIAKPYTILPPQTVNLEIIVHTVGRFGGVHCLKPLNSMIVENI